MFIFVFQTKNENITILQSQANDEKSFIFVVVKEINDSIKKNFNKKILFFEKFIISFD